MADFEMSRAKGLSYSYAVMSVLKAYNHNSQKCSGFAEDSPKTDLILLNEKCDQAGIPLEKRHLAFSEMLNSVALNFYFSKVKQSLSTAP